MQNNRNLHSSEISALYKIFKSQLPNSIILTGQDTDIISTIARNLASLIISRKLIENRDDFEYVLLNSIHEESNFILKIEPVFLEDKQRFKKKLYREDVKYINDFFSTKDDSDQKRACIINLIDDLSLDAANSVLKIIEEPNRNNHFIIVNQNKSKCLKTIVSRSHRIFFGKLKYDNFANYYRGSENEEYLNYLYRITNGSSYLTKQFIEYNFYEINDHFKTLLTNQKKIKANTANHYIEYLHNFKNLDQAIPVFFNYLQLVINDEIKKLCHNNENNLVIKLLNIYALIDSFNKKNIALNLDFENLIISLFHRLKYD